MAVGSIHALCICVVESLDSHGKGTFVGKTLEELQTVAEENGLPRSRRTDSFVAL